ncbi:MAG TPA: hypothetical protein VLI04_06900, partial [Nocardioidaceae bacterium]|nr:hypothetical protein [Nocardioidaceae bacterium]
QHDDRTAQRRGNGGIATIDGLRTREAHLLALRDEWSEQWGRDGATENELARASHHARLVHFPLDQRSFPINLREPSQPRYKLGTPDFTGVR